MPIDARINMGLRPQTYDAFAAYDTGRAAAQTAQANQMAMQAAQAEAELNRNAMLEAQTLDPNDRAAQQRYALRYGAAATPRLTALSGVDTNFAGRGTERRAEGKFETEQSEAYMTQLPRFASQFLGVADIPGTAARIRPTVEASGFPTELFDTYVRQLSEMDPAQAQQALQSYLLTTGGGETAVKTRFGPRTLVNTGATQEARNLNPLALDAATGAPVPVTGPIQNTPDPRAPTIFSSSQGAGQISSEGTFTPVTDAEGNPIMPYQAPSAGAAAADETRQNAAEGVRSTIDSMLGYYENLERMKGIVSTERGPAENIVASIGASLPGRVVGRTIGSREQTERDNIQTAIPMLVASLKDLTGMSAQQMNSNVELQLFLNTVSAPDQSIETVREAFARFGRYVDSVSGSGAGGGPAADPLEGRTAVGPGGRRLVRRDGQWVPQ